LITNIHRISFIPQTVKPFTLRIHIFKLCFPKFSFTEIYIWRYSESLNNVWLPENNIVLKLCLPVLIFDVEYLNDKIILSLLAVSTKFVLRCTLYIVSVKCRDSFCAIIIPAYADVLFDEQIFGHHFPTSLHIHFWLLTFMRPCIFNVFLSTTNKMQCMQYSLLLSVLYMFRAVFPLIIRSSKTVHAVSDTSSEPR
jgi:hypothetical protein